VYRWQGNSSRQLPGPHQVFKAVVIELGGGRLKIRLRRALRPAAPVPVLVLEQQILESGDRRRRSGGCRYVAPKFKDIVAGGGGHCSSGPYAGPRVHPTFPDGASRSG